MTEQDFGKGDNRRHLMQQVSLCALAFALSACGGGGGGGSSSQPSLQPSSPPPTPVMTADDFRTTEYENNWGLEAIGAAEAYASGYTGEGVTIGIVDFNFDFSDSEINFHPASADRDQQWVDIYEAQIGDEAATDPHGTAVAWVMAAQKDDLNSHGVAFDARVLAVDFFAGVDMTEEVEGGVTYHVANPYRYAVQNGARIVNKSLGYDEDDIISNPPVVSEKYVNDWDAHVVDQGGLLVVSAGNNGDPEPSLSVLDTMSLLDDNNILYRGDGALIIVGAVDENNEIADFSDRAGDGASQNFYLVAPGVDIVTYYETEDEGEGLYYLSGTSFSAPHVSGAAAIVMQRWPTLSAREVANILFDSATDLGAPGVDEVYGHGMLNINLALQPQGAVTVAVKAGSIDTPLPATSISLGGVFGDAGSLSNALSSVTIVDGYNRDFQYNLSRAITSTPLQPRLDQLLDNRKSWKSGSLGTASDKQLSYSFMQEDTPLSHLVKAGVFGEREKTALRAKHPTFEFQSTVGKDAAIRAGHGRSLASTLTPYQMATNNAGRIIGLGPENYDGRDASYVSFSHGLKNGLTLDYGASFSHKTQDRDELGTAYQQHQTNIYSVMSQAAYLHDNYTVFSRVGVSEETGSLHSSYSSGALSFTDGARHYWLTTGGQVHIADLWQVSLQASAGLTKTRGLHTGLISGLDTIVTSSWSAEVTRHQALGQGSYLRARLYQPKRAEIAKAVVSTGAGVNWSTGQMEFTDQQVNIVGSGREIASEIGAGFIRGAWALDAAIAFRRQADHTVGKEEVSGLISLRYNF